MVVRLCLLALSALVATSCAQQQQPTGYCGRELPRPSHGTTYVSTVEVRDGDVVSGFPAGVEDFYVMPRRAPAPGGNGLTEPYLAGLRDGRYDARFVTFPVRGIGHHGVRMTVAGRDFNLEGPRFCG